MLKKIMMASLAVSALALNVPAAHAEHAQYDCGFETLAQETATGGQDTYTGAAYGFIASPTPQESVSIRCYVSVDGSDQGGTNTGSGTNFATTQGQVTFTASDTQEVLLCAEWSAGSEGPEVECFPTTNTQIPPQPVIDLLDQIFAATGAVDFLLCPILGGLAPGVPGVLDITPEGDVSIAGSLFWDCPPYEV